MPAKELKVNDIASRWSFNQDDIRFKFKLEVKEKHGNLRVLISGTDPFTHKRVRGNKPTWELAYKFIDDWEEAERAKKYNSSKKETTLSNDQLRDAEAALTILSRLVPSKTLVDAVNFYGKRFINSSISIKDAKRKWDEEAGRKGLRPDTFRDRKKIHLFFEKFGHRKVVDITTGELNSFVDANYRKGRKPNTVNGYIRNIRAFFSFCKNQKWIKEDPALGVSKMQNTKNQRPSIFSCDQVKELIKQAALYNQGSHLAYFSILCFSGLRPSEIHDGLLWGKSKTDAEPMTWDWVRLDYQPAQILLERSKASLRNAPIYKNLQVILRSCIRHPIIPPTGFKSGYNKVRELANLKDAWEEDICRHSWVSYLFAKDESLCKIELARMAGNSDAILEKAYLNRGIPQTHGEEYFKIGLDMLPERPDIEGSALEIKASTKKII